MKAEREKGVGSGDLIQMFNLLTVLASKLSPQNYTARAPTFFLDVARACFIMI